MLNIISVIISAVVSIANPMPASQHYVNTAYASPKSSLAFSALFVGNIPETILTEPPLKIASDEFESEKVANHEEEDKSSSGEATEREKWDIGRIEDLIKQYFPNEPLMVKVAQCESELVESAKNKNSSAKGIFQILDGTWEHFKCEGNVLNAEENIKCGVKILAGQGLSAWSESFSCWKNI